MISGQAGAQGEVGAVVSGREGAPGEVGVLVSRQEGALGELGGLVSGREGALGEDATHHTAHTEMASPQNGRGCETSGSQSYEMPAKWKQEEYIVANQ